MNKRTFTREDLVPLHATRDQFKAYLDATNALVTHPNANKAITPQGIVLLKSHITIGKLLYTLVVNYIDLIELCVGRELSPINLLQLTLNKLAIDSLLESAGNHIKPDEVPGVANNISDVNQKILSLMISVSAGGL